MLQNYLIANRSIGIARHNTKRLFDCPANADTNALAAGNVSMKAHILSPNRIADRLAMRSMNMLQDKRSRKDIARVRVVP